MTTNTLTWGNPDIAVVKVLKSQHFLDTVFNQLECPHPHNESVAINSELSEITRRTEELSSPHNTEALRRFMQYDANLLQAMYNTLAAYSEKFNTEDIKTLIENISADLQPFITKLKFRYNRPRPNQIASQKKLLLFPYPTKTVNSPSYPSGSVLKAIVILEVLGDRFPEHYAWTQELLNDIAISRVYLGHNYNSDIDFSYEASAKVLRHPAFTSKYSI